MFSSERMNEGTQQKWPQEMECIGKTFELLRI